MESLSKYILWQSKQEETWLNRISCFCLRFGVCGCVYVSVCVNKLFYHNSCHLLVDISACSHTQRIREDNHRTNVTVLSLMYNTQWYFSFLSLCHFQHRHSPSKASLKKKKKKEFMCFTILQHATFFSYGKWHCIIDNDGEEPLFHLTQGLGLVKKRCFLPWRHTPLWKKKQTNLEAWLKTIILWIYSFISFWIDQISSFRSITICLVSDWE